MAAGAKIAAVNELPSNGRRTPAEPNPFTDLVRTAAKDHKRRDLPGRFSLAPYEGRKNANEFTTVSSKLYAAARIAGCKIQVRKLDPAAEDTGITFRVSK